jgi:glycosyltransferase involved in cell wall biosynthesis
MRIALFHNLPSGGAKRHTLEQLRELSRRGHIIEEFAPSTADLTSFPFNPYTQAQHLFEAPQPAFDDRRVPFITPYIHTIQGLRLLRETQALNRLIASQIDQQGFDLAFVKDCRFIGNPYILRYLHTPSLYQCHHGMTNRVLQPWQIEPSSTRFDRLKRIYYWPAMAIFRRRRISDERKNIRAATRVITNSRHSRQILSAEYGIESHVVYPGINQDVFYPRQIPKSHFVLSVGSLTYQKGFRFLVSALKEIEPARRPALHITSNFSDPIEENIVREMAKNSGVDLKIEKISDDNRLAETYSQARAFVYAPIQEALGLTPLEAMACGTPVVAVDEAGVNETVLDGVTGFLVQRDPAEFALQLIALLEGQALYDQMSRASVEYVRQQWTWQQAVDRLENQFQQLLYPKTSG